MLGAVLSAASFGGARQMLPLNEPAGNGVSSRVLTHREHLSGAHP